MVSAKHINNLNFGAFEIPVMIVIGFSFEEAKKRLSNKDEDKGWVAALKKLEDMYAEPNWGFVSWRTVRKLKYFFLVLKDPFDFSDESHARLAHEVLHLVTFALSDIIDIVQENECFCYHHTYLMKQCYKILRS